MAVSAVTKRQVARTVGHVATAVLANEVDSRIASSERLSDGEKAMAQLACFVGRVAAHALVEAAASRLEG